MIVEPLRTGTGRALMAVLFVSLLLSFILHVSDYAGIVESLCLLLTPKKNGAISIREISKDKKILRGKGEKESF